MGIILGILSLIAGFVAIVLMCIVFYSVYGFCWYGDTYFSFYATLSLQYNILCYIFNHNFSASAMA